MKSGMINMRASYLMMIYLVLSASVLSAKTNLSYPAKTNIPGLEVVAAARVFQWAEAYQNYLNIKQVIGRKADLVSAPECAKFVYEKGANFFCVFDIAVDSDVVTYWKPTSSVVFTYHHGKDTCVAESNLLFFLDKNMRNVFLNEVVNELVLPNPRLLVRRNTGGYALVARFDFRGKEPEDFLSLEIKGVRYTMSEARARWESMLQMSEKGGEEK